MFPVAGEDADHEDENVDKAVEDHDVFHCVHCLFEFNVNLDDMVRSCQVFFAGPPSVHPQESGRLSGFEKSLCPTVYAI